MVAGEWECVVTIAGNKVRSLSVVESFPPLSCLLCLTVQRHRMKLSHILHYTHITLLTGLVLYTYTSQHIKNTQLTSLISNHHTAQKVFTLPTQTHATYTFLREMNTPNWVKKLKQKQNLYRGIPPRLQTHQCSYTCSHDPKSVSNFVWNFCHNSKLREACSW